METGNVVDRPRSGRRRIFNEREERNLVRSFISTPGLSCKEIERERQANEQPGSRRTVRRILRRNGLVPKTSEQGKEIVKRNKKKRVTWAREHLGWSNTDWSRIVFSDEATLYPKRTKTFVRWTRTGVSNPAPFEDNLDKKSINVWGYIRYDGLGELIRFEGDMRKEDYLEMLDEYLFDAIEDQFNPDDKLTFMQDGASYHTTPYVTDELRRWGVNCLPWPPQSPDLNPIENLWACLRQKLWERRAQIKNSNDTWRHACEIFNNLTLAYIRKLYSSMHKRLESVIELKGNRTRF